MRLPTLFMCLAAAVLAAMPLRPIVAQDAPPSGEVTFNLFYDNLSDDGEWYNTPDYGYVWQPDIAYGADNTWRPYTDGYWAQTDSGWTWVSYENFGWATYHYGRWTRLKDIGWAWVPGYEWGPGWVSWRTDTDYVGWAPLPPKPQRVVYEGRIVDRPPPRPNVDVIDYEDLEPVDTGYTPDVDYDYDIGPENYCFVQTQSFGAPVLSEVILPPQRNVVIIERTTNVTNIYYDRRGPGYYSVYNSGPDYNFLRSRVDRPIQTLQIEQRRDPGFLAQGLRAGGNPTQVHNGILQVAAPLFARRPTNFQQIKPPRVKETIAQPQVVHGWSNTGADTQTVDRLRNQFKEQAQQAPQKAVQPKEQVVQPLPPAQRVVTKSDLPVGAPKDMSPDAVAARRAQRQQQRAVQGGGNRPGQPGQPGQSLQSNQPAQVGQPSQPKDMSEEAKAARRAQRQAARNGQPGQPTQAGPSGQPNSNGPRPAATTEDERKARRDAAIQQKAARDQARTNGGQPPRPGQPAQAGQPNQPGQPKDTSEEAKAARRAQRQQERGAQQGGQPGATPAPAADNNLPAAQPKDNSEEAKAARRAQRQQERAAQQNQGQPSGQPAVQPAQNDQEREARRAQRQQERAQQPQGNPQADAEREARRAQRQQERTSQPQQADQAQQQVAQEREVRQAQRQQERAQQQAAQQGQQQQAAQEREARQAQRQQERAAQPQPQPAAQPQAQQGNADRDARRAARQAEKGRQPGDNPNQ